MKTIEEKLKWPWILIVSLLIIAVITYFNSLTNQLKIERLERSVKILTKEVSNLQHDSIMLKGENLILYLKGQRMDRWYDTVFNQGGIKENDNDRAFNTPGHGSGRGTLHLDRLVSQKPGR